MPLAFDSISHGSVAFGFFNIESDMLLLEHDFFFASDFCAGLSVLAEEPDGASAEACWQFYHIPSREDIGDLMGAIHGIRTTGFIGEVYRRFPFPERPEAFRQNPDGWRTRALIEEIIGKYARVAAVQVRTDGNREAVWLGEYGFSVPSFRALIRYVWVGGYPRWKEEVRPGYVHAMKRSVAESINPMFYGMVLEP